MAYSFQFSSEAVLPDSLCRAACGLVHSEAGVLRDYPFGQLWAGFFWLQLILCPPLSLPPPF